MTQARSEKGKAAARSRDLPPGSLLHVSLPVPPRVYRLPGINAYLSVFSWECRGISMWSLHVEVGK